MQKRRLKRTHLELFRPLGASRMRSEIPEANAALQAIWHVIASIPRGRVSTYGEVARAAGFPGRARQTGYALRTAPSDMHLPWHRVLGAAGKISFPKASSSHREQVRLLRSEGIVVKDGRVDRVVIAQLQQI